MTSFHGTDIDGRNDNWLTPQRRQNYLPVIPTNRHRCFPAKGFLMQLKNGVKMPQRTYINANIYYQICITLLERFKYKPLPYFQLEDCSSNILSLGVCKIHDLHTVTSNTPATTTESSESSAALSRSPAMHLSSLLPPLSHTCNERSKAGPTSSTVSRPEQTTNPAMQAVATAPILLNTLPSEKDIPESKPRISAIEAYASLFEEATSLATKDVVPLAADIFRYVLMTLPTRNRRPCCSHHKSLLKRTFLPSS